VTRIVGPGTPALERPATVEVAETVAMEERVVHIDRVAEPIRPPAPTAPSQTAEEASDINTRAEPESKTDVRVIKRRIVTIDRRSPHVCGIVDRHVNHLRVGRLNVNRRLSILRLSGDVHLGVRLQSARLTRLAPQPLHGLHDVGLLSEKGVPQIGGPTNIRVQPGDYIREDHQRLDTGIPVLLARGLHQLRTPEVAILLQPLPGFDDLERIGSGDQNLAQQGIGIERDGRYQIG